jgi:nucleoid-associated protein YgaU
MRYDWLKTTTTLQSPTDTAQIQLYDVLNVKWRDFSFPNGYVNYVISRTDLLKPWLIAFKFYNDAVYEDFIYLVNGISNPLDLQLGQTIKIPRKDDIEAFLNSLTQT